jgi:hypothetical protein
MRSCKKHVQHIGNGLVSLAESGGIESRSRTEQPSGGTLWIHGGKPKATTLNPPTIDRLCQPIVRPFDSRLGSQTNFHYEFSALPV